MERVDRIWPIDELRRAINRNMNVMKADNAVPQPGVGEYVTVLSVYTGASLKRNIAFSSTTVPDFNNRKTMPH